MYFLLIRVTHIINALHECNRSVLNDEPILMIWFQCPQIPRCSTCSSPPTLPRNPWQPLISIVLPFPQCHVVRIIHYVAFSDWFLLSSNMHLSSSCLFMAYFFLSLKNSPLSEYNTVCLSIHVLQDIVAASRF